MSEVYTVTHIKVDMDGLTNGQMNPLLFNRATPPAWSCEAPKHEFHGDTGAVQTIISSVQNAKHGTVELTQGLDKDMVMSKWKALVMDPKKGIDEKKKKVTITWLDSTGEEVFSWHTEKGLLTGYSHS